MTSCLAVKWYIQHAFQDNSLENVNVCTNITFKIIENLTFWSKKVCIEIFTIQMSPVQFYREYNWCLKTTIVQAKRPQNNSSKIKTFFSRKWAEAQQNIYILIRTVTRNQMHMDNRHITMLDEMFHHVQHFLPKCWHAQIFWQERQWPRCWVIWLWRDDCISGLIHVHTV